MNPERKNKNGAHVEQDYDLKKQNNYGSKSKKVPNYSGKVLPKPSGGKINLNSSTTPRRNPSSKSKDFTSAEFPNSSLKSQFNSNLKSFRPNETFPRNSKPPKSYKSKNAFGSSTSDKFNEEPSSDSKLIVPNIRYINSLTTAHFGGENPESAVDESKIQLTEHLNLTQALDYLRNNKTRSVEKFRLPPKKSKVAKPTSPDFEKSNGLQLTEDRSKRSEEENFFKNFTQEKHSGRIKKQSHGKLFSDVHIERDFPKFQFSNFHSGVKKNSNLQASTVLQRHFDPFYKNQAGNTSDVSRCYKIKNREIRNECIKSANFFSLNLNNSPSQLGNEYLDPIIFSGKITDKNAKNWIGDFPPKDIFTRKGLKYVSNHNENLKKFEKDAFGVLSKEFDKNHYANDADPSLINNIQNSIKKHRTENFKSITAQNQSKFLRSFSTGIKSGSEKSVEYFDNKNWIPITDFGPLINPKESVRPVYRLSRKTDEVTLKKNKTSRTLSSDHYVIDELKEDENVRRGEVVEDTNHYFKITTDTETKQLDVMPLSIKFSGKHNSARSKREAQGKKDKSKKPENSQTSKEHCKTDTDDDKTKNTGNNSTKTSEANGEPANRTQVSKLFQKKRTLTRLSGSDFLTRYLKKHSKPDEKVTDFWKVSIPNATTDNVSSKTEQKQIAITEATAESTTINYVSQSSEVKEFKAFITTTPRDSAPEKKVARIINKEPSELQQTVTATSTLKNDAAKPEIKQPKEFSATSSPDTVQPQAKKKTEIKQKPLKLETAKKSDLTEVISSKPKNQELKKQAEIPRETDRHSSTKSYRRKEPAAKKPEADDVPFKSRTPHLTTINRNSDGLKGDVREEPNKYEEPDEGPILYYIVNERTRRGRWVSHPSDKEARLQNSKKRRKVQKHKIKTIKRKKLTN